MASRAMASTALLLALNLLFFTLASSSSCPTPSTPKTPTPKPAPKTPATPKTPAAPKTTPASPKTPAAPAVTYCPIDTLKLGVCANVLGLINLELGAPPKEPCCSLLAGLADAEAAVCLCTALKANILGINLNIPIDLSLLVNYCGKSVPTDFVCGP